MKMLNPGYESNTGELCVWDDEISDNVCSTTLVNNSLWWNSGNGNFYRGLNNGGGTYNLNYAGLSSKVHNKIASVVWNLGGYNSNDVYPYEIYLFERGVNVIQEPEDGITRTTKWTGKVALMYPSDIGYAVDVTFSNYTDDCYNNNYFSNYSNYLLTPNFDSETGVWRLGEGQVFSDYEVAFDYVVMPSFYLTADTKLVSGNGSKTNPYKVG